MDLLDPSLADSVIRRALRSGADFAELFVERKRNQSVSVEESQVQRVNSGNDRGAGLRIIHGGVVSYIYTEDLSEDGLLKTADVAASVGRRGGGSFALSEIAGMPHKPQAVEVDPQTVDAEAKIELLLEADQAARAAGGEIRQVAVGYGESRQEILVVTSEGIRHQDARTRVRLMVHAVAERNGEIQTAMEAPGAQRGFEFFDDTSPADYARMAAERALMLLTAAPSPAGTMPVVVGNEFGGVLFHEACGHGLEADFVSKGSTVFAGKIGQQVASPIVTAIDDGTLPARWGTLAVDDEGVPTRRNVLIQDGVLVSYMFDRLRAGQLAHPATGNGRRQSYQHLPIPRMTNTFIAPGAHSVEGIIAATPRGLYARKLGAGQVDVITGDFVFAVTEGYLIEGGRIGRPVRGATIVGNGPRALHKIDMVGNDLKLAPGTCGKEGQGVPVSVGQPTIRISELLVGGTGVVPAGAMRP
ncbi:MAG TPA: TldD/PmbA family protein [Candidatus Limnocylindrales bacterium]|nr:TldD/PmbA family protein [Candidatus Limnocylindrales bacterium]